ncbi:MAG: serine acetyltransferase [Flavobacteriaceae bacterium]|nr:serine acetyltransferase [Flavobacteriaceae bacterium]
MKKQTLNKLKKLQPTVAINFKLKELTEYFTARLYHVLFDNNLHLEQELQSLSNDFESLVDLACLQTNIKCECVWSQYVDVFPEIFESIQKDAQASLQTDPAANSLQEIFLAYPGFFAIAIYRLAHPLYQFGLPLVPRLMTEYAHGKTGIDIHPGAQIGAYFHIDHGTGVVIGETTIIQDHVKIYQGVTLGGLTVNKNLQNCKRHPTIESNVTIYANATILGGETIIGSHTVIGGNSWLVHSVPPYSKVYHNSEITIKTKNDQR